MRKISLMVILLLLISTSSFGIISFVSAGSTQLSSLSGSVNQHSGISIKCAEENVKIFAENPAMALMHTGNISFPGGDDYILSSGMSTYYVNQKNGDVEVMYNSEAEKDSKLIKLSLTKAEDTAKKFAESKYKDFGIKNMVRTEGKLLDHGDAGSEYVFSWCEKINTTMTPNWVSVTVNPNSGDIINYIGIQRPITISTNARIDQTTATQIAIEQFKDLNDAKGTSELFVAYTKPDTQQLLWVVEVNGGLKDGLYQGGEVIIDALNGDVINVNPIN